MVEGDNVLPGYRVILYPDESNKVEIIDLDTNETAVYTFNL